MNIDLKSSDIGWGERLGIIDFYNLTNEQALIAFETDEMELEEARSMKKNGEIKTPKNIQYGKYITEIAKIKVLTAVPNEKVTATQHKKPSKRRGPKSRKIEKAFNAITTTSVPAEEISNQFKVSLNILKQGKRFDKTGRGKVHVKKNRITGVYMIWRDKI